MAQTKIKNKDITVSKVLTKIALVLIGLLMFFYCLSLLLPLLWAVLTAFKTTKQYTLDTFGLPDGFYLDNFKNVFGKLHVNVLTTKGIVRYGVFDMLAFTLILAIGKPFLVVFFTTLSAYCFAKFKFIGSKFLYNFGFVVMILPIVGAFPSQMMIMRNLNIYNELLPFVLISPQGCFFGLQFLILVGMFKRIPTDYSEAAVLDGAGNYLVLFKIMIPMAFPTMIIFFVLGFLGSWSDYSTSLIWLPSYPTLGYGMYVFQMEAVQYNATVPEIMAGLFIVMVPSSVFFLSMQKSITSKFHVGGLKG